MASVDFRTGGFDGAYRRRVGDYGYDSKLDGNADDPGHDQEQVGLTSRLGKIVNYMGAVVSVTLVVGLGVWGYRLVTRDVSGVPVIRAMVGEARVAPADPGGELTRNTGLAVNAVPGGILAVKPNDKVAIAPSATGLAEDDLAMGEYGAVALLPGMLSEGTPLADANDPVIAMQDSEVAARRAVAEAEAAALAAAAEREAAAALMADAPAAEAAVNGAVTSIDGTPADAGAISAALAEANSTVQTAQAELEVAIPGALAQSSRPASRPARRVAAAAVPPGAAAAAVPAQAQAPVPAPQASVASGGSVVQLGAFDSDAIARSEWNRIAGKSGGLFSGKGQIVQRYERDGRVFYRLRVAGFESNSAAEAFCSALKAKGTDCLAMRVN